MVICYDNIPTYAFNVKALFYASIIFKLKLVHEIQFDAAKKKSNQKNQANQLNFNTARDGQMLAEKQKSQLR